MEKYREGQKEFHPVALHKAYNRVPKEELQGVAEMWCRTGVSMCYDDVVTCNESREQVKRA